MAELTLQQLKPLTSLQYDQAREAALKRVGARIGEKPERKKFVRDMGAIATPLDWIALVVFIAALAISSVHIIAFMGEQAESSYKTAASAGVVINADVWAVVHQLGAILLAESAAILFMTMHTMSSARRAHLPWYTRWLSIPILLAGLAATFVLMANITSGVNLLVSLMPPLFTLGIAVRLEAIIAKSLTRRDDVSVRYLEARVIWEQASQDPTKHPDFMPLLRSEIWQALAKKNRGYEDAPVGFRVMAVRRELERETWAQDFKADEVSSFSANGHGGDPRPLAMPPQPVPMEAAAN